MATPRERRPGVWEIRVFTGRDKHGGPTQVSKTVRGTKREAKRGPRPRSSPGRPPTPPVAPSPRSSTHGEK